MRIIFVLCLSFSVSTFSSCKKNAKSKAGASRTTSAAISPTKEVFMEPASQGATVSSSTDNKNSAQTSAPAEDKQSESFIPALIMDK